MEKSILVTVENDCIIGEKKNMNLPGCEVHLSTVSEKDKDDIVNFGLKNDIDMIALSFTRKGSDIDDVRKLLGPKGIIYK
jgi:pyruvate kinase